MSFIQEYELSPGKPAIVRSQKLVEVLQLVKRVAPTSAAVLISGETGSGKELVARSLHNFSLRCNREFVDVNCGALPDHLVESELFGYEKGAFSGADAAKPGFFELASGGTLFLDEIGELDARAQVKLLRVLDGIPYYRLGGVKKVAVDVRVVAASATNLEEAVHRGTFRRDLFYRLSQVHLKVPPLRERIDDIEPMAKSFLQQHDNRYSFSAAAMEALQGYEWPGNIRQLKNVVIQSALFSDQSEIQIGSLPPDISLSAQPEGAEDESMSGLNLMERNMIHQTLSETGGQVQKAAEKLGISRRTLSRKLKLYSA